MPEFVQEDRSYSHDPGEPCTSGYITPIVLKLCRELGARRVLDIGCGNGALCRSLADAGLHVVGMEPSISGIDCARRLVPEGRFYQTGVYDDPDGIPEGDFDVVVSTEVIEHLVRPTALPQFAARKLKPGGVLVISTPYHGYLKNLLIAATGRWDAHHAPGWEGGHIKFWSRGSLTGFLNSNGFKVTGFAGAGRLPRLWKTMILTATKGGCVPAKFKGHLGSAEDARVAR